MDLSIAIVLGIITGLGVGGGSIMILYLTLIKNFEQEVAKSINLVYFLVSGFIPIISFVKNKEINKEVFLKTVIAGVVASILTGYVASVIEVVFLKRCFGVLLIYIGINLVFKKDKNVEKKEKM